MFTYQDIEPANPAYCPPGLRFLTFQSPALGRRGDVTIYIPPGAETMRDLPMVVLLHGVLGSHWSWCFMGGAHLRAQELIDAGRIPPVGLVMPSDGDAARGTGYVRTAGPDFEAWVVRDVVDAVTQCHECFSERSPRYLGGFSMGGYGAMLLGARHPGRFRAISAHSSATHYDQLMQFMGPEFAPVELTNDAEKGVLHWIVKNRAQLPQLRFDCGVDDHLVEHNRALHTALDAVGVPHIYTEFPGRHSWQYWHDHLADTLEFFVGNRGAS